MHAILRTFRTQWLGALGLLVGVTGVAFGATGQPALLGKLNQADKPTVFQNTGTGPAATFKTKVTQPPFEVTSGKQVPMLNSSRLAGRLPSAFTPAGYGYSMKETDTLFAPVAGSPNYLPATGMQVIDVTTQTDIVGFQGVLSTTTFTAPANGQVHVTILGECSFFGAGGTVGLSVAIEDVSEKARNISSPPTQTASCSLSTKQVVSGGTQYSLSTDYSNTGNATLNEAFVLVVFKPE